MPYHLVGHWRVVVTRHAGANSALHQAGQRRKHIHGRVDLAFVQVPVNVNLEWRHGSHTHTLAMGCRTDTGEHTWPSVM